MKNSEGRKRALVVGAGFTGLATAYFLDSAGYAVEVYERNARAGGMLGTIATVDGLVETAANAFLNSARVEALFQDIEVPLLPAGRKSRARFMFRNGFPQRWPLGLFATFRFFVFLFRFFFARASVTPLPGESLSGWGTRVLGGEVTEYLIFPAFQGIYAGDGKRLSASLLTQTLFTARKGTPRPRFSGSVSAPGGMGEVIEKLREKLVSRGVVFHFGKRAEISEVDCVYYCGSASQTAEELSATAPDLSRLLSRIEMLPLVSVTAFFPNDPRIHDGFGVLFPPSEAFHSLGVLYNHLIFPGRVTQSGVRSETWIFGGARHPEKVGYDDEKLVMEILADRKRVSTLEGPAKSPQSFSVQRWEKAIPYYTTELESLLGEIAEKLAVYPRIRIFGNYLGGIGLTKILEQIGNKIEKDGKI